MIWIFPGASILILSCSHHKDSIEESDWPLGWTGGGWATRYLFEDTQLFYITWTRDGFATSCDMGQICMKEELLYIYYIIFIYYSQFRWREHDRPSFILRWTTTLGWTTSFLMEGLYICGRQESSKAKNKGSRHGWSMEESQLMQVLSHTGDPWQ